MLVVRYFTDQIRKLQVLLTTFHGKLLQCMLYLRLKGTGFQLNYSESFIYKFKFLNSGFKAPSVDSF